MEAKADLHVHSIYSEHPSEWFLQRIGAGESYSQPEHIYRLAKSRGMNYVTITDHNRIDGIVKLMDKHPDDTFMGVETTAYFPEDGCKVHILLYDFKEKHFEKIQKKRKNIYKLRDYIYEKGIAHSVAHINYSVNGMITIEHIKKLILMFDVFEAINGGRSHQHNRTIQDVLLRLQPEDIENLVKRYGIQPYSHTPWKKGFTAGSDDHAGLFIAKTWTVTDADNTSDFIKQVKLRRGDFEGRSNNFQALAFMVYKIAWDYSKNKGSKISGKFVSHVNDLIFEPKQLGFMDRIRLRGWSARLKESDIIMRCIVELVQKLERTNENDPDRRFDIVFDAAAGLIDKILIDILNYFSDNIEDLDILATFSKISSLFPAAFMSAPFITAMNHMFQDRELSHQMRKSFSINTVNKEKKILWFTDTINDLNGVSVSLKELAWLAYESDKEITFCTSLLDRERDSSLPPNLLELDVIYSFVPPYYDKYIIKVPSILKSLKRVLEMDPDEIYISTPGPVGLVGLIASKILHVPATGIFHSDFKKQLEKIADDDSLTSYIEPYLKWFYSSVNYIASPTMRYEDVLIEYGYDPKKITLLNRWIDTDLFSPQEDGRQYLQQKHSVNGGPLLLYSGRISKEKNLDVIVEIFRRLCDKYKGLTLMLTGDGPYMSELQQKTKDLKNIVFTGEVKRNELPKYYSGANLLLFPSDTDTFGMAVLEAQACGLPCLVSDQGGPAEIITEGKTGYAISSEDIEKWVSCTDSLLGQISNADPAIEAMHTVAVANVRERFDNRLVLESLLANDD